MIKSSENPEIETRKDMELKRRITVLNYRKEKLTNELSAINKALFSLNQQVNIGKQLSF